MVRTARQQRPDRGIMEDLRPRRDYPMSTHDLMRHGPVIRAHSGFSDESGQRGLSNLEILRRLLQLLKTRHMRVGHHLAAGFHAYLWSIAMQMGHDHRADDLEKL